MNILYYTWDEIIVSDMTETLEEQGHSINVIHYDLKSYVNDAAFVMFIENELAKAHYDCIMTTNYFPVISKISLRNKIKYISWIFDSPCFTTYSEMIYNPYNYVFHFDSNEVIKLRAKGVQNIFHMPLAVNTKRVAEVVKAHRRNDFDGLEVSFLGNLYTDTNFFDMIAGVGDYHKGYINAAIDAQLRIWGYDIISEMFSGSMLEDILKLVKFNLDDEMFITDKEILLNMISKKASINERQEILTLLADKYNVTLFSQSDSSMIPKLVNKGYVNYSNDMPLIFANSKINLNISLRSIVRGIPLRALDIMGAGGFLLSNYQPELAEMFVDGEEMVMYYSREDLVEKVKYYLEHDEERCRIAENGRKKIEREFDYSVAWKKIFEIVG